MKKIRKVDCTVAVQVDAGGIHFVPDNRSERANKQEKVAEPYQLVAVEVSGIAGGKLLWVRMNTKQSVFPFPSNDSRFFSSLPSIYHSRV